MNKEITICKGCGRKIHDKTDVWDEKNTLCDKCSIAKSTEETLGCSEKRSFSDIKQNASPQTINNLNLSYIN